MPDRLHLFGRKSLGVLVLFALLSLVMTFPLITRIGKTVVHDLGDPLLVAWTLAWDAHQLSHDPFHLFEGNFFYPCPNVLAYSEHMVGDALLVFPLLLYPQLVILVYNLVYLLSFILSGWGVYLLVKHLSCDTAPAIIAGLLFAFSPYRLSRLSHLHILSTQWVPFIFLFLHKFAQKPSWKNAVLASLFYVLQGLCCNHYAVFLYPVILLWAAFFLFSQRSFWSVRNLKITAVSTGLALILLIPFFLPYLELRHALGLTRSIGEARVFSAHWSSYLSACQFNRIYGKITSKFASSLFPGELWLFPGLVGVMFSVVNIFRISAGTRRALWAYGAILFFSFLMSFGPRWTFFGREFDSPYRFLYNYLPGWNGIRVPARIYMISTLALSILAGFGANHLGMIFKPVTRKPFFLIAGGLILLESFSVPLPLAAVPPPAPVYHWLAAQPGKPVVLELPMPVRNEERWKETAYLYYSIFHWKPLINGYSGYFPPYYQSLCETMQGFPDSSSLAELHRFGVKYVIWHSGEYGLSLKRVVIEQLATRPSLSLIARFEDDWVFSWSDSRKP